MLVTRQHESGVLLSEKVEGDAGLLRALKQIDRDLVLWPPDGLSPYWRVLRRCGDDRPAEPVLTWMTPDGAPLPLTSGILDAVQRLRRDGRNQGPTVDELNAARAARMQKDVDDNVQALHDDFAPYLERGRTSVGMGSKDGRLPYWLRRGRGGDLPS